MQRAKTPAAQKRPRRTPLQELKQKSDADRTNLTPLFRRLRLKDHDCATPVSCALGPRNSVTAVPCNPRPPRRATLAPPSTPMTSTRGLRTPVLKLDASEAPSNATLIPGALETSSSTSPEASGSSVPVSSMPELPDNTVPAPLCSPVLGPNTPEPSSTTVPASVCSSIPVPSTSEPSSTTMPTSVCSSIPVPSTSEPSSTTVPASVCSSIPVPSTSEPSSTTMPTSVCSSIPVTSTSEPSSTTMPASVCSSIPVPSTSEPSSTTMPTSVCSSIPVPSTSEPSSTTMPTSVCSSIPVTSTPKRSSSIVPVSLCSTIPVVGTLESPGRPTPGLPNIISSVSCKPNSPGSSALPPCSSGSPGNDSTASCTPGPPGTSSTPQKAPFHGWRPAPPGFSCSLLASEPPSANGSADSLNCQGTPDRAEFPAPVPPEQSPPDLPPIKASGLEPAGSEATLTPVTSPESTLGAVSRMFSLVWLEKTLNSSFLVESLGHSLPLCKLQQDVSSSVTPVPTAVAGTSVTPVPTAVAGTSITPVPTTSFGTSMTPVPTMATGTSMTPVLSMATGTVMTPRDVWERSMNTSRGSVPCAKDSATETFSLLWHCPREQLKTLPRAELEGRLESMLIIIEVLLLQLRDWQKSQQLRPGVGPAEQRDAFTQTIHSEGEYLFLKAFFAHASAEISARDQRLVSQQELSMLLARATNLQASLSAEVQSFQEFLDVTFENLEKEKRALDEEREQVRALVFQSRALLERVPGELRSYLEELAATWEQAKEALQAKEEVSCQLEKTLVTLQDTEAQLQQLTVANSRLGKDLSAVTILLARTQQERDALQQERDALQQENEKQREEMAQLAQGRNSLQEECKHLCQELLEATECQEFLNQERKIHREELLEVEARLNSTLATLQERVLQHEELMETHQRLWEEQAALSKELDSTKAKQAALSKELDSTKAELLSLQIKRNKVFWCSTGTMESKMQLQELADCLKAALEEQDDSDALSRSQACTPGPRTLSWQTPRHTRTPFFCSPVCHTPHHASSSFVGSVLKAVAGKDANETTISGSTVAKDKLESVPKPTDPEDTLLENMKELRAVVSNLAVLSTRMQELEQSKFRALQTEISDLQLRLETLTAESQEKLDNQAATIAMLNKALRTKIESEKELQDVVKQQEEKILQYIDKSREVMRLEAEVSHLKCLHQRAETEAKVLWEEMRGKEHQVDYVQERVMLRQEVDKLTLKLVEKENENIRLNNKYLEQIQGLEMQLHRTQKVVRTHEEMQENITGPVDCPQAVGCQELQSLMCSLSLKPARKKAAEPL